MDRHLETHFFYLEKIKMLQSLKLMNMSDYGAMQVLLAFYWGASASLKVGVLNRPGSFMASHGDPLWASSHN